MLSFFGVFLSENTISSSEHQDSITVQKIFFSLFAEAAFKPHCVTVSLFLVYYLVTMLFFLYIVFSILVIEEKEKAFSL